MDLLPDWAGDVQNHFGLIAFFAPHKGKHEEAEPLFERSIAIYKMTPDAKQPNTGNRPDLSAALEAYAKFRYDQVSNSFLRDDLLREVGTLTD